MSGNTFFLINASIVSNKYYRIMAVQLVQNKLVSKRFRVTSFEVM